MILPIIKNFSRVLSRILFRNYRLVPHKNKEYSVNSCHYLLLVAGSNAKRKKAETLANTSVSSLFYLAGDEGIEPPPKVLETPIIPLDQSPILLKHTL